MSRNRKKDPRKSLLKDLESIRGLLHSKTETQDDEVPLLDDVVMNAQAEGDSPHEEPPTTEADGQIIEQAVLGDDLFQALLGDDWATSTAEILEKAREEITQSDNSLTQSDSSLTTEFLDELNEKLKVIIDETVHTWMQAVLVRQADELRNAISEALSKEIASNILELSSNLNSEGADGE